MINFIEKEFQLCTCTYMYIRTILPTCILTLNPLANLSEKQFSVYMQLMP